MARCASASISPRAKRASGSRPPRNERLSRCSKAFRPPSPRRLNATGAPTTPNTSATVQLEFPAIISCQLPIIISFPLLPSNVCGRKPRANQRRHRRRLRKTHINRYEWRAPRGVIERQEGVGGSLCGSMIWVATPLPSASGGPSIVVAAGSVLSSPRGDGTRCRVAQRIGNALSPESALTARAPSATVPIHAASANSGISSSRLFRSR